ncbi:MAG: hypothetical protein ACLUD2_04420 [Clostridium sp.]
MKKKRIAAIALSMAVAAGLCGMRRRIGSRWHHCSRNNGKC